MTNHENMLQQMRDYGEELRNNPVRLKEFLRKVMGPPCRVLVGQEKDNVWLMIQLIDEPTSASNNQHTITEVYHINQKEYHVTYFHGEHFDIAEMLPDD